MSVSEPHDRRRPADQPGTRPLFGWADPGNLALLTDLYELTMAQSYWRNGMNEEATFDLFVRESPANRRFLVAAGLEQCLAALESFRFEPDAIEYLASLGRFDGEFLAWLSGLRFTGEVRAIPEGEPFLPQEPLLEISGPLIEAQLAETLLLNTALFQSMIASKAARVVLAADGREVVDFSPRRDHGTDAALKAARASFIAGCGATSNVLAGWLYGIDVTGTMAHAFVMAFEREIDAFRAFAGTYPGDPVLLIDTYDTLEGARRAAEVGRDLDREGRRLLAVRLDSGDIATLSCGVRAILDEGGCAETRIFVSGDMNEWRIADLVAAGAPVDAFGVGTELGTSADAPSLAGVYKLVAYGGRPTVKRAPGKQTYPGRKQVWRGEEFTGTLTLEDERVDGGEPLLRTVMTGGTATGEIPALTALQARCRARVDALPAGARDLAPCPAGTAPQPAISEALHSAAEIAANRR